MATCPICKSDAEEIKLGFIDGKTFRCAKHGEFQVSQTRCSTCPPSWMQIRANGRPH